MVLLIFYLFTGEIIKILKANEKNDDLFLTYPSILLKNQWIISDFKGIKIAHMYIFVLVVIHIPDLDYI